MVLGKSVAITSASFFGFDAPHVWADQPADVFRYTEENFPLRKSITPHIQSKIPKMFGWQMNPGYDFYIYADACYELLSGAAEWLVKELEGSDILVFQHPYRSTISEEAEWLKENMAKRYVRVRYEKELLEEQCQAIAEDASYKDDALYHAAIFIYRNNDRTQKAMKEWWYHVSRFHLNDQLSFPYVLKMSGCLVKVHSKKIAEVELWKYHRHAK